MKTIKTHTTVLTAACFAVFSMAPLANAQTVRHDFMDRAAARRDMKKLEAERAQAVAFKNWSKVYQDDRLIAADKLWIRRDQHRIHDKTGE